MPLSLSYIHHDDAIFRKFTENTLAQLFYFIKCVYFCLSAYQIRSSYPTRFPNNFLTNKYVNYMYPNLFLFKDKIQVQKCIFLSS